MKKNLILLFLLSFSLTVYARSTDDVAVDTAQVMKLDSDGYQLRRSDAEQTITKATKALQLAKK